MSGACQDHSSEEWSKDNPKYPGVFPMFEGIVHNPSIPSITVNAYIFFIALTCTLIMNMSLSTERVTHLCQICEKKSTPLLQAIESKIMDIFYIQGVQTTVLIFLR